MKRLLKGLKLSLVSYVSLAFIFFLFISATTLVTVNYYRMVDTAFEATLAQFDRAIKQEKQSLQQHFKPASFRLNLHASQVKWQSFSNFQTKTNLQHDLANYLAIDPLANAVHLGFENGDFVSVKQFITADERQQYNAPPTASFAFEILEYSPKGQSKVSYSFLNSQLEVIGSSTVTNSSYQVFNRPWYIKGLSAKDVEIVDPYQEYDKQNRIISLVLSDGDAKVVHAIDINLQELSELMQLSHVTESDVQIILSSENKILAYQYSGDLTLLDMDQPIAEVDENDQQAIINFASSNRNQKGLSELTLGGQTWVAKVARLNPQDKASAKLLIATPKAQVVTSAKKAMLDDLVISWLIILLFIPLTWLFARALVRPIRHLLRNTHQLAGLQFNKVSPGGSFIEELDELEQDMWAVSHSLEDTFTILNMLAKEKDIKLLAKNICIQGCEMLKADAAFIYRADKKDHNIWKISSAWGNGNILNNEQFFSIDSRHQTAKQREDFLQGKVQFDKLNDQLKTSLIIEGIYQSSDDVYVIFLPLVDRDKQVDGFLCFTFTRTLTEFEKAQYEGICTALSKFISVAFEGNELLDSQKQLLKSFIHLIAGAIDTKSPYTGAHCQRMPTLTMMLAEQAAKSEEDNFKDFSLSDEQWNELKISAWLHDCGKVTTPENVVDKATKLETIYNRIHEVRMRFEVLRRDAHINSLKSILAGEEQELAHEYLTKEVKALEEDFAFIAQCNLGEEMMSAQAVDRIEQIAQRKWLRYFDDSLGLSPTENARKSNTAMQLPITEFLLADKPEHCIEHNVSHQEKEPQSTYAMEVPKYRFNLGELNNLAVKRGTINAEERYIINHHIVQTIEMLEQLPFPDNLKRVAEIAGGHHEQINGKGYPKGLKGDEICIETRILTIADIFEALTASDRPYKEAKSLSQSIAILNHMRNVEHIDSDLFELFLSSGIYLKYAKKYLKEEQIDQVDISQYLSSL